MDIAIRERLAQPFVLGSVDCLTTDRPDFSGLGQIL